MLQKMGYNREVELKSNFNTFFSKITNNEDFFNSLIKHANHFENLLAEAKLKNSRLKFVASLTIPESIPFSNVIPEGKTTELHLPLSEANPLPRTTVGIHSVHIGISTPCDTVILFEFR